jgi:hypothetical protein
LPIAFNALFACLLLAGIGKYGILCIEDIVHEIASVGPHFKEVANFLYPFKLNQPAEGGLQGTKTLYKHGGEETLGIVMIRSMN